MLKWDPPHEGSVIIVICNYFCKTFKKSRTLGNEGLGIPKVTLGSPTVSPFCIKLESLEGKWTFSQLDWWRHIVRRTISFCKKKLQFACWRKLSGIFKCCAMDLLKRNYFVFSFVSINYEIVLTLWTYVLVCMFFGLFYGNFH